MAEFVIGAIRFQANATHLSFNSLSEGEISCLTRVFPEKEQG
jgi:hypothetical protein